MKLEIASANSNHLRDGTCTRRCKVFMAGLSNG